MKSGRSCTACANAAAAFRNSSRSLATLNTAPDGSDARSTTARMAANLGFEVTVVSDATATFGRSGPDGHYYGPDEIHRTELAILHGEFATVRPTEAVLAGTDTAVVS